MYAEAQWAAHDMKSMEADRCASFRNRLAVFTAAGFGLGLSPVASGTFGTIPGVFIAVLFYRIYSWLLPSAYVLPQLLTAIALTALAVPLCDIAEKHFARKDDGRIVADEFMTFPLCVVGLPLSPAVLVVAFITNRFFDIVKPPPARKLQNIKGGKGIVVDDFISCLYSLAVNHAIFWMLFPYF